MEEKKHISDELLAKYMSGKASSEEEAAVLDYLAENDNNLEDFIHINEALRLNNLVESNERRKRRKVVKYISAAAAVALLVIVSLFAIHRFDGQSDQFAQEQTPSVFETDSTIVNPNSDSVKPAMDVNSNSQIPEQTPVTIEPKHYADSSHKVKYANMIYPSKKRTSISKEKKQVDFRWNTDAVAIHLNVRSDDGKLVTDQHFATEKYYNLTLPDNVDTVLWQATFTYADGTTSEQNGMIIRWDTGLKLND